MDWREGKGYEDLEGNFYHIIPVNDKFTIAKYAPVGGVEFIGGIPWRITASDAQRALDEMAREKGWLEK